MGNKEYTDLAQLRRDVVALIRAGRYRPTYHAEKAHPEIPLEDKRDAILHGECDRPNRSAAPGRPSYVCWFRHPRHGLLRSVYAIVEPPAGGQVVAISVFQE